MAKLRTVGALEYQNFDHNLDSPLYFAEFGLNRQMPDWAPIDWGGHVLHLGPGNKHIPGTIELEWPDWNAETDSIDLPDGCVGGIIATHFLEHLASPLNVLREAGRVLREGCPFNILVPHGQSIMYLQDLDHKTPYVLTTWKNLLQNPYYDKDRRALPFEIGANFTFAVKEGNVAVVTQLIKRGNGSD